MNHSQHFWVLVESILPNFQASRQELRAAEKELPAWITLGRTKALTQGQVVGQAFISLVR